MDDLIAEIRKLSPQPGDILVFECKRPFASIHEMENFKRQLAGVVGEGTGVRAVVIPRDADCGDSFLDLYRKV